MKVTPKKHLGQHFLRDLTASKRIADLLSGHRNYRNVLEIGPGMGVLTQYILPKAQYQTYVIEIDGESVEYQKTHFPALDGRIIEGDFLKMDLDTLPIAGSKPEDPLAIIGNFPYNISSQIFFKILENPARVPEVICMLQKEVAKRIASPPGNKEYGILSVLLQAYYDIEYVFSVAPGAFNPPPKVNSGVIRLRLNDANGLGCDDKMFFKVVKAGFNQRRKTLRNALKILTLPDAITNNPLLEKRAEQLNVAQFVELTNYWS